MMKKGDTPAVDLGRYRWETITIDLMIISLFDVDQETISIGISGVRMISIPVV
jgi:hypothetical protein